MKIFHKHWGVLAALLGWLNSALGCLGLWDIKFHSYLRSYPAHNQPRPHNYNLYHKADLTKAFELVHHSLLFQKLLQEGLSLIFLRILRVIYTFQYANVRWNGIISSIFSLCNGVRQGAILSGILYCFYVNNIFNILRRKNDGCWVNNNFHGLFGYSDDNWVLAPSLDSLREMMKSVEEYCNDHNFKFSTDLNLKKCKTKFIAFL